MSKRSRVVDTTSPRGAPSMRLSELELKQELQYHDEGAEQPMSCSSEANLVCCQCGATQTPQWREGPLGPKTLCNACGVKYYRQAKRTRKGGGGGGGARAKARRVVVPPSARRAVAAPPSLPTISSDSYCTTQTHGAASDASEEAIEEHDAAMSLLCFAGVDTVPRRAPTPPAPAPPAPAPAVPKAPKTEQDPVTAAVSAAAAVVASTQADAGATPGGIDALILMLGAPNPPTLPQLQSAADAAQKEAAAADAAITAVSRFLQEKQEEAHCARVRLALAEQMLLQRMRQMVAPPAAASGP